MILSWRFVFKRVFIVGEVMNRLLFIFNEGEFKLWVFIVLYIWFWNGLRFWVFFMIKFFWKWFVLFLGIFLFCFVVKKGEGLGCWIFGVIVFVIFRVENFCSNLFVFIMFLFCFLKFLFFIFKLSLFIDFLFELFCEVICFVIFFISLIVGDEVIFSILNMFVFVMLVFFV